MRPDSTDAAFAAVRATHPGELTRDGCEGVMAQLQRVRSALAAGAIAGGHVDALAAAMKPLPDEVRVEFSAASGELIARARHVSLDTFQRECRQFASHLLARSRRGSDADELARQRAASKVSRWVDQGTGMHHTRLELDPVRDAKLNASINRALARLRQAHSNAATPWQQLQVEALLDSVTGNNHAEVNDAADAADGSGTIRSSSVDRVPEITVIISWEWLTGMAHDAGICETENGVSLPLSTVRRLCCDAEIVPAVLGGRGEALDVGRSSRTATRGQRRALRALHRGCAHPAAMSASMPVASTTFDGGGNIADPLISTTSYHSANATTTRSTKEVGNSR